MEGLVDLYYKKLAEDSNKALVLTKFYCELFSLPFAPSLIKQIAKLLKLYGDQAVFFSILDISNSAVRDYGNIYALLNHICRKRFEHSVNVTTTDLSSQIEEQAEKIEKLKKHKFVVRSPFDE